MGTSKGYLPPTGYLWPEVKRDVTKMVKNNFSSSSIGKAVSGFSKSLNSYDSSRAGSAIQASSKALSFIDSVKRFGFIETLEHFGLSHLKNESPEKIRSGLLQYFSEGGNEFYENIASQSMNEFMRELLEGINDISEYETVINSLDTGDFIREFIIKFIQNCFFANFTEKLLTLFDSLDKYEIAEQSVKTYIRNSIETNYTVDEIQSIDWTGKEGSKIITDNYNKALEILSVWSESID